MDRFERASAMRRTAADLFFEDLTEGTTDGFGETDEGFESSDSHDADLFFAALTGRSSGARTTIRQLPAATEDVASLGEVAPGPIDAVVMWPTRKAYFFYGDSYVRYDVVTDRAD